MMLVPIKAEGAMVKFVDYSRTRSYRLPDGILTVSRKTWRDLPPTEHESYWPKPSGWRFWVESKVYGPSMARFRWRQRAGLSYVSPNVYDAIKLGRA